MRGLWYVLFLVLGTGLVAACDRDEDGGGLATAPSLASTGGGSNGPCSKNTLTNLVKAAFNSGQTRNNVVTFAENLASAFSDNKKGKATWWGFKILQVVDTAVASSKTTLQANSNLVVGTLGCMTLGTAPIPTSVETELGTTGAFGVRGRPTADVEAVIAHDDTWIIEPPETKSWQNITTLQTRTGITGDTAKLFLVLGKPGSGSGFVGTGDQLLAGSFDWSTIPTATFGNPYVVVGQCVVSDGFLQHFPASSSSAEIFSFVQPAQCPATSLSLERAPRTLAERLFRAISPAPAYATALLKAGSGGGSKPALSPFGIINPGQVNLSNFSQAPTKKDQVKNKVFNPTPIINPTTAGGVAFKQASVLTYLSPIVNNGTPGFVCYNWAYNDDEGVTDFPQAFYTKAGGLSLIAKTVGTVSTEESTGEPVPVIAAGANAVSPSVNVKNSSIAISACPTFDGTTYFTNILNPNAQKLTFNPQDAGTFPPNLDLQ
ncbi:MAG TPA: hypothetical protein VH763_20375 [Gemmatimonadales bacterium]|jgi:hypothetical protein